MKRCPGCNSQYTDDTLRFCLQDGTPLEDAAQSDTPTLVLDEAETVAARAVATQQSQVTHVASVIPPPRKSRTPLVIAAVSVVVVVMLSAVVIALFVWRNFPGASGAAEANASTPISDPNRTPRTTPTPLSNNSGSPTPTGSPTANGNIFTQPPVDNTQVKNEITQKVNTWKSLLEAHDINAYMTNYADNVEYFKRGDTPASFIRKDKESAMSLYSSMRVTISNLTVTVDPTGDSARAEFDKEWVFEGKGRYTGKTRTQLDFKKINGKWLITVERDQKVYNISAR